MAVEESKRKWTALVCQVCRFVMRAPADHFDEGIVCPSCRSLLTTPSKEAQINKPTEEAVNVVQKEIDDERVESGVDFMEVKTINSKLIVIAMSGFLFLGVVLAFLLSMLVKEANDSENIAVTSEIFQNDLEDFKLGVDEVSVTEALEEKALIADFVKTFFESETASELESMVMHPEITIPRMHEFYQNHSWISNYIEQRDVTVTFVKDSDYIEIGFINSFLSRFDVLLKRSDDSYLVDWEGLVGWSNMDWDDFVAKRPQGEKLMRVICEKSDYYNGAYADDEKWICLKLTKPRYDKHLYAYMPKMSADISGLSFVADVKPKFKAILKLEFSEDSSDASQVIITKFIDSKWAHQENEDLE